MKSSFYFLVLLILLLFACRQTDETIPGVGYSVADSIQIRKADSLNERTLEYLRDSSFFYKEAILEMSTQSIGLSEEIDYPYGKAMGLYLLGRYWISIAGDPARATHYLLESLEIFSSIGDQDFISRCYVQLGLINYLIEFYDESIRNLILALDAHENHTAKYLLALSYTKNGEFPEAMEYFKQSIEYYQAQGENSYLSQCYLYMGQLYLEMEKADSSFIALDMAEKYMDPDRSEMDMIRWYAFVSRAFLQDNQIDSAIYYGEKSYFLEKGKENELKDDIALIKATQTLSRAYEQKNSYKKAYFFMDEHHEAKTMISEGSSNQKISNMLNMFEFEQKMAEQKREQERDQERATQEISSAKQLRNFLIGGAILLLLLLILLYNRYTIKRDSHNTLEEKNAIISKEKERSDELLLNILPEEIAEELKKNGEIESRIIDEVTVIFTDFKGFTSLTDQLTPKQLVSDLHECFSAFDHICEKYGVEKIKTIGDAYMAVGGMPTENKTHASDAINAALDMVDFIEKGKEKKRAAGHPFFEIRVGLHTGPVVAGIVGFKKFQYDIWGDTVNIANRMETHGQEGKINISEKTYALLKGNKSLAFECRGKMKVKGSKEIEMWFVERKQV